MKRKYSLLSKKKSFSKNKKIIIFLVIVCLIALAIILPIVLNCGNICEESPSRCFKCKRKKGKEENETFIPKDIENKNIGVYLVNGQSNSVNASKYSDTRTFNNQDKVHVFYKGKTYNMENPLAGSEGKTDCVWKLLGEKMIEDNKHDHVVFAITGCGGACTKALLKHKKKFAKVYKDLIKKYDEIDGILYHQGESDSGLHKIKNTNDENEIRSSEYYKDFNTLMKPMVDNGYAKNKIYVSRVTMGCKYLNKKNINKNKKNIILDPMLGAIQDVLRDEYNAGPNTDTIGLIDRYDNCHFNDEGLNKHAKLWFKVLYPNTTDERLNELFPKLNL